MTLSHEDFRSLLGASALDALPDDEVELLEVHLEDCDECRDELSDLRMTTSMLVEPAADAPPGVWDDIVASIRHKPEEMPRSIRRVVSKRNRWLQGWALVATGAVAAVIILAVSVANLNSDVSNLKNQVAVGSLQSAAEHAVAAPGHELVELRGSNGAGVAQAVITTDGVAYLLPKDLHPLASARTYQLWAESRGVAVSLGVLGAKPGISAFRVEPGMTALMLTAEPSGGVQAPTSAVIASGTVPSSI
jgi:predicted anti-sigma-YlaC factor YlaD